MANVTSNYHETLDPPCSADEAAVTLATTYKALIPTARYSQIANQFFIREGRRLRIVAFGKITTVLTPGNGQMGILFGTNADANGVNVVQTAAFALTASQTNLSWRAQFEIECRSKGATGTLFGSGIVWFNNAVVATSIQPILAPASAAVVSSACDLTGTLVPSLQFLRSGSTAETMTVQSYSFEPLN